MQKEAPIREPLILGNKSYHDITVDVARPVEGKLTSFGGLFLESHLFYSYGGYCV